MTLKAIRSSETSRSRRTTLAGTGEMNLDVMSDKQQLQSADEGDMVTGLERLHECLNTQRSSAVTNSRMPSSLNKECEDIRHVYNELFRGRVEVKPKNVIRYRQKRLIYSSPILLVFAHFVLLFANQIQGVSASPAIPAANVVSTTGKQVFLNGTNSASFCLFSFFSHDKCSTYLTIKYKNRDGVLGTRNQGWRMVGADESTKLWRHPTGKEVTFFSFFTKFWPNLVQNYVFYFQFSVSQVKDKFDRLYSIKSNESNRIMKQHRCCACVQ